MPASTGSLLPAAIATRQGLPTARLHAANGADAVVAWNASSLTASIVWEGSEEKVRQSSRLCGSAHALGCNLRHLGGAWSASIRLHLHRTSLPPMSQSAHSVAALSQIDWAMDAILFFSGGQAGWAHVLSSRQLAASGRRLFTAVGSRPVTWAEASLPALPWPGHMSMLPAPATCSAQMTSGRAT